MNPTILEDENGVEQVVHLKEFYFRFQVTLFKPCKTGRWKIHRQREMFDKVWKSLVDANIVKANCKDTEGLVLGHTHLDLMVQTDQMTMGKLVVKINASSQKLADDFIEYMMNDIELRGVHCHEMD